MRSRIAVASVPTHSKFSLPTFRLPATGLAFFAIESCLSSRAGPPAAPPERQVKHAAAGVRSRGSAGRPEHPRFYCLAPGDCNRSIAVVNSALEMGCRMSDPLDSKRDPPPRRPPVLPPTPPQQPRDQFTDALRTVVARCGKACVRGWGSLDRTSRAFVVYTVGLTLLTVLLPTVVFWGVGIAGLLIFASRLRRWRELDRRGRLLVRVRQFRCAVALVLVIGGIFRKPAGETANTGAITASDEATPPGDWPSSIRRPVRYTVTKLGTLGGEFTNPVGINNAGQVVGYSGTKKGDFLGHAFLWQAGIGMRDLGTLGGEYSRAKCINNDGQVVGTADTGGKWNGVTTHEFVWDSRRGMRDLNKLIGCPEGEWVEVTAINDQGDIVGRRSGSKGFLLRADGRVVELASINALGEVEQLVVNNKREVAATVRMRGLQEGRRLSIILQPDGELRQLPIPGGEWSWGSMSVLWMNGKSQVVFAANDAHGGQGVFLREASGELRNIKMPPLDPGLSIFLRGLPNPPRGQCAYSFGINNRGQIVGAYGPGEEPGEPQPEKRISEVEMFLGGPTKPFKDSLPMSEWLNAFIYDGSTVTDLNTLIEPNFGWHIETACGINDRGQIIATAGKAWINNQGQWHSGAGESSLTCKAALLLTRVP